MITSLSQQLIPISTPPFCPRFGCPAHFTPPVGVKWWERNGTYYTALTGAVRRFRCHICRRGFSEQTFHIDYYAKRRLDYARVGAEVSSCMGIRAIGRSHGVDHKTVGNKLMRLARQAMAAQAQLWDAVTLEEDLVADGFESYWVSQYFPNNLHLLAGADSQFLYALNGVTIRRSGRMSEKQLARRERLERHFRADPRGVEESFGEILEVASDLITKSNREMCELRSDEHGAYRRAIFSHGAFSKLCQEKQSRHITVSSTAARTRENPLFAVNYLDRELRKDVAEHVRESTRFSRSVHGTFDRLNVYCLVHNLTKQFRLNDPRTLAQRTHASQAGIDPQLLHRILGWVYHRRAFRTRSAIRGPIVWQWLRMHTTPLERRRAYLPEFLFA